MPFWAIIWQENEALARLGERGDRPAPPGAFD
jgi:hypothetical protein